MVVTGCMNQQELLREQPVDVFMQKHHERKQHGVTSVHLFLCRLGKGYSMTIP